MDRYWTERLSEFGATVTASEIRELLKVAADPDVISFAGGIPDPRLFPFEEIREAYRQIFASNSLRLDAFQYAISEGYLPLRQWIGRHMGERGVAAAPENILITNGSQQGLDFVARLLLRRGDTVVVARPSYLGALRPSRPMARVSWPCRWMIRACCPARSRRRCGNIRSCSTSSRISPTRRA
jgi:DNA-binding transcriptional MocR family regulator